MPSIVGLLGKEEFLMRNKKVLILGIAAVLFLSLFTVSCLTTDTAYRVGYDVGSWLAE